jgi:predicted nucleic acid-binding protein
VTAFLSTNVLVRHLTGDPPEMAGRATALLAAADELLLPDVIVAEVVQVLESFYEVPPAEAAGLVRSVVTYPPIRTLDQALLLRALEIHETARVAFAEAYLGASAEAAGVASVASFDRGLDRLPTVRRIEH